jgi:hypothetical protein
VFTSVTGLFTVSFSVWEPLAYEPPTTETVAVFDVSETSSKRPLAAVFGFEDGKIPFVLTDSDTPFTEITAEDGGGFGGAGGTAGGDGDDPDEPPEPELLPDPEPLPEDAVAVAVGVPPANGSLLSNRENDSSWPGSAEGLTAASSCDEPVGAAAVAAAAGSVAGTGAPASEGAVAAVGSGVVVTGVVVGVAFGSAACGFDAEGPPLIDIIVWTAYAIARASTQTSAIAIFFCFAALSFAASAGFLFLAMCLSFRAD